MTAGKTKDLRCQLDSERESLSMRVHGCVQLATFCCLLTLTHFDTEENMRYVVMLYALFNSSHSLVLFPPQLIDVRLVGDIELVNLLNILGPVLLPPTPSLALHRPCSHFPSEMRNKSKNSRVSWHIRKRLSDLHRTCVMCVTDNGYGIQKASVELRFTSHRVHILQCMHTVFTEPRKKGRYRFACG